MCHFADTALHIILLSRFRPQIRVNYKTLLLYYARGKKIVRLFQPQLDPACFSNNFFHSLFPVRVR